MLSVIIPFVNEHPQAAFTAQGLFNELHGSGIEFEIVMVENWCEEVARQEIEVQPGVKEYRRRDNGFDYLSDLAKGRPWLKVLHWDEKLSHWQCKNQAVAASRGDILFFIDAHCLLTPGSLVSMYRFYRDHHPVLSGSLHLPIYYLLENPGKNLIYKLVVDLDRAIVHYSFTPYAKYDQSKPIEVPCMSTCGMMMTRELYDWVGGWPTELGIYGGGENFMNFTLSILGKKKWIWNEGSLWHYAAKRGYNWRFDDFHRNRAIASFIIGGADFCRLYMQNVRGNQVILQYLANDVIEKCHNHEQLIRSRQVISIRDWVAKWTQHSEKPTE